MFEEDDLPWEKRKQLIELINKATGWEVSDLWLVPPRELIGLYKKHVLKKETMAGVGMMDNPERNAVANESMLPKKAFAGSDKNKLGAAGQWRNKGPKKNKPAQSGDFVGGESYEKKKGKDGKACWKGYKYAGQENGHDKCVKVGKAAESIISDLISILESK
jgi:hypothetical protein